MDWKRQLYFTLGAFCTVSFLFIAVFEDNEQISRWGVWIAFIVSVSWLIFRFGHWLRETKKISESERIEHVVTVLIETIALAFLSNNLRSLPFTEGEEITSNAFLVFLLTYGVPLAWFSWRMLQGLGMPQLFELPTFFSIGSREAAKFFGSRSRTESPLAHVEERKSKMTDDGYARGAGKTTHEIRGIGTHATDSLEFNQGLYKLSYNFADDEEHVSVTLVGVEEDTNRQLLWLTGGPGSGSKTFRVEIEGHYVLEIYVGSEKMNEWKIECKQL